MADHDFSNLTDEELIALAQADDSNPLATYLAERLGRALDALTD